MPSHSTTSDDDSYILLSSDNRKLWCNQWKPNNIEKARCAIYICHGYGEHCMVYDDLAKLFTQRYDALVFANDHFSHGRSEGEPRAYTDDFMTFVEDMNLHIDDVYTKMNQTPKTLPLFIFGHSMGGAISLLYSMKYPKKVSGLMLMSPLVDMSELTCLMSIKVRLSKLIHNFVPSKTPVSKLDFRDVVSEERFVIECENDPWRFHGWMRMGMASSFIDAVNMIEKGRPTFNTPVFLGHGSADRLCCLEASRRFMDTAASKIKTFTVYENGAHALLKEYENGIRERFLNDLTKWLDERTNQTT